ncbi:hypothetical protein D6D01_06484 [Aureobasidium pullulans]|uniref:Zn(2)-C6 fungal-type domain-containing protein n=1 Tax=Aureobasidium pullulans TaxID=5580 RepID=A0A4S9KYL7_AURPU|nr:hypothetical protein D6D01_06484 [Aureobasidium pullulans]
MVEGGKLLVPDAPTAVPQVVVPPVAATRATAQAAPPESGLSPQNQNQNQESEPREKEKPIVLTGCRACHLRSVKCNGGRPCLPCSHSNLPCTYDKTMVNGETMYLRDDGRTRNGELAIPDYNPSLPTAPLHSWRSASGTRAADFDVSVDPFPVGDTYHDEEEEIEQKE